MGEKLPYMPLNVFALETDEDCRAMPDAQFGRYMRLLIRQWVEGSVPADAAVAIRVGMLDHDAADDVKRLLDRKFSHAAGKSRRMNPRCAAERESAFRRVQANRRNGKLGGRPKRDRSETHNETHGLTDGLANPSTYTSTSDPPSDSDPDARALDPHQWPGNWLHEVLQAYPYQGPPVAARKAIAEAATAVQGRFAEPREAIDFLKQRAEAFARSDKGGGKYAPMAKNWFLDGGYDQQDHEWQSRDNGAAVAAASDIERFRDV